MSKELPLRPQNEQFTDKQWQAIFDGAENILVSASAGSGKTTVLVRRVIEKLKQGVAMDHLLIVTYTEAAAKEMKERIQQALQSAISQESDVERKHFFIQQLTLLPMANISTLHAFCLTVIRRFYYLIEIDPVFRLLTDETEMLLLKEDVWDELREELYTNDGNEWFYQLTSNFSNDRSDEGLTKLVFSLYEFARANPDPAQWLSQLADRYRIDGRLGESSLYQTYLKPIICEYLFSCGQRYDEMLRLVNGEEKLRKIETLAQQEKRVVEKLLHLTEENELDACFEQIHSITFERYPSIRVEELKETANQAKQLREQNKKMIMEIGTKFFVLSPDEMQQVLTKSVQVVQGMARIAQQFIAKYSEVKLRKGLVDFNDLEHLTVNILAKKEEDHWQGTEASDYYREKFDEVLVDEYQDINRLQEAILSWLCRTSETEGNLFMVGDVKQSIYSFRLADPTLFIEKYIYYGEHLGGKRIVLAENFRSRKNVLDFTNLVFSQLMDESVGQISYDESAELLQGFTLFSEASTYDTELLIYEKEQASVTEEVSIGAKQSLVVEVEDKTEGELYMVALKIRELVDQQFLIYDKGIKANRPVTYQDIVLLSPTKKNNLTILEIFKSLHIPIQVNDAQNYFQATEIQTMVCLLQLIDNPYQDIPLAAVLRSPIVGLKEKELSRIRLAETKHTYYEAFLSFNQIKTFEEEERKMQKKTLAFAQLLAKWRDCSRQVKISTLLSIIYQDTGYLDYVLGLPAAKQRQANLYALVERAQRYEQTSFRGLFQFVRFIEKMREKDKDLAEPAILSTNDAVRVMTIHASKGLEFPVVFILDMSKEFNLGDLNERYIFDEKLGVGIRYLDQETRLLYDTLPFLVVRQEKMKKLLSEEMRKLYVALTRAEQKLYLIGSYKNQATMWKDWLRVANVTTKVLPSDYRLRGKSSLMDWVGMSLMRHEKMADYQNTSVIEKVVEITTHPASFSLHFCNETLIQEKIKQLEQPVELSVNNLPNLSSTKQQIAQGVYRLNYIYPYEISTKTTNYQSVSEIKRIFEDPTTKEASKISWSSTGQEVEQPKIIHRLTEGELGKPAFIENTDHVSAAAIGTATHRVMQLLDLAQSPSVESIGELIEQLIEYGEISRAIAQHINKEMIVAFYHTHLGQLLLDPANRVRREQPFSMLLNAEELIKDYPPDTADDLLIHGMIDGYIEGSSSCILYDYKTDRIQDAQNSKEISLLIKRYKGQLNLYKKALTQATTKQVEQVLLILLDPGLIIDMEKEEVVERIN